MKQNKSIFLLSIFILSILLLTACKKENNIPTPSSNPSSNPSFIKQMNIQDATNLFTSSSVKSSVSSNSKMITYSLNGDSAKKLFKITEQGYIEEVTYTDQNGNTIINNNEPKTIININDQYVYVDFEQPCEYLINKSNGYVYPLENIGKVNKIHNDFINSKNIQTDSFGNIYYMVGYDYNLVKLDTSNPNNIIVTQINPTTERVNTFKVDKLGNVVYKGILKSETSSDKDTYRIKKTNGGFYNFSTPFYSFWVGLDGNFYYYNYDEYAVKKVVIDSGFNVTETRYSSGLNISSSNSYLFSFQDKMITLNSNPCFMHELYNSEGAVKNISLKDFSFDKITVAAQSKDYLYVACNSNSTLIKINPDDYSYELLLTPGTYDISSMTVSDNDNITFNALRMSDGKQILGQIDSKGKLSILDESSQIKTTVLERIK